MAQPQPTQPKPEDWLAAARAQQVAGDREVLQLLRDSYKRVQQILKGLPDDSSASISSLVARAQYERTRQELLAEQATVFRRLGDVVSARRLEAAARAAKLSAAADAAFLRAAGATEIGRQLIDTAQATARRGIELAMTRLQLSAVPLAERIYNTGVWMNNRLNRLINAQLASGINAHKFAKIARDWFNPSVPGGTRYAALRLARTEINNAFHAETIDRAQRKPWVQEMEWHLSRSHPKKDGCDALRSIRFFKVNEIPRKPHPQCMCFVTEREVDEDEWVDRFVDGEFDDWLDEELGHPVERVRQEQQQVSVPAPEPQRELTGQDAHDVVPKGLFKRGTLTPEQRKSLKTYESGWFVVLQSFLRGITKREDVDQRDINDIAHIDSAMAGSVLSQPIETWRGMYNSRRVFGDRMDRDLTGFSWAELGYSSTTTNEKIAETFRTPDSVQDRVRKAYRKLLQQLPGSAREVSLARLRDELDDINPGELDRKLLQMDRNREIQLEPDPDRRNLTERAKAASVFLGGEQMHLIVLSDQQLESAKTSDNVKMRIHVAAGVQALETSTWTKGSSGSGPQAEITLQHGLVWTVVKDNGIDTEGVRHLEVTVDIRR